MDLDTAARAHTRKLEAALRGTMLRAEECTPETGDAHIADIMDAIREAPDTGARATHVLAFQRWLLNRAALPDEWVQLAGAEYVAAVARGGGDDAHDVAARVGAQAAGAWKRAVCAAMRGPALRIVRLLDEHKSGWGDDALGELLFGAFMEQRCTVALPHEEGGGVSKYGGANWPWLPPKHVRTHPRTDAAHTIVETLAWRVHMLAQYQHALGMLFSAPVDNVHDRKCTLLKRITPHVRPDVPAAVRGYMRRVGVAVARCADATIPLTLMCDRMRMYTDKELCTARDTLRGRTVVGVCMPLPRYSMGREWTRDGAELRNAMRVEYMSASPPKYQLAVANAVPHTISEESMHEFVMGVPPPSNGIAYAAPHTITNTAIIQYVHRCYLAYSLSEVRDNWVMVPSAILKKYHKPKGKDDGDDGDDDDNAAAAADPMQAMHGGGAAETAGALDAYGYDMFGEMADAVNVSLAMDCSIQGMGKPGADAACASGACYDPFRAFDNEEAPNFSDEGDDDDDDDDDDEDEDEGGAHSTHTGGGSSSSSDDDENDDAVMRAVSGSTRHANDSNMHGGGRRHGDHTWWSGGAFTAVLSRTGIRSCNIKRFISYMEHVLRTEPYVALEIADIVAMTLLGLHWRTASVQLPFHIRRLVYEHLIIAPPRVEDLSAWLLLNADIVRVCLREWQAAVIWEQPSLHAHMRSRNNWDAFEDVCSVMADALRVRVYTLGGAHLSMRGDALRVKISSIVRSDLNSILALSGSHVAEALPPSLLLTAPPDMRYADPLATDSSVSRTKKRVRASKKRARAAGSAPRCVRRASSVAGMPSDARGYLNYPFALSMKMSDNAVPNTAWRVNPGSFWHECRGRAMNMDAERRLGLRGKARACAHTTPLFDRATMLPVVDGAVATETHYEWPRGASEPDWRPVGSTPSEAYKSHPLVFAMERMRRRVDPDTLSDNVNYLLLLGVSGDAVSALNSTKKTFEIGTKRSFIDSFLVSLDAFDFGAILHFMNAQHRQLALRFTPLPSHYTRSQLRGLCAMHGVERPSELPPDAGVVFVCKGCMRIAADVSTSLNRRSCSLTSTDVGTWEAKTDASTGHVYCRIRKGANAAESSRKKSAGRGVSARITVNKIHTRMSALLSTKTRVMAPEKIGNRAMRFTLRESKANSTMAHPRVVNLLNEDTRTICHNEPMTPVSLVGYALHITGQAHISGSATPASKMGETYMLCACNGTDDGKHKRVHVTHYNPHGMYGDTYKCVGAVLENVYSANSTSASLLVHNRFAPKGTYAGEDPATEAVDGWKTCAYCLMDTFSSTSVRLSAVEDREEFRETSSVVGTIRRFYLCKTCVAGNSWMQSGMYRVSDIINGIKRQVRTRTIGGAGGGGDDAGVSIVYDATPATARERALYRKQDDTDLKRKEMRPPTIKKMVAAYKTAGKSIRRTKQPRRAAPGGGGGALPRSAAKKARVKSQQ